MNDITGGEQGASLVGTLVPVDGDPRETFEFGADGSIRISIFRGSLRKTGVYRFTSPGVVEIDWGGLPSPGARQAIDQLNEGLAEAGADIQLGVVDRVRFEIEIDDERLVVRHAEKGRHGRYRRVVEDRDPQMAELHLLAFCVLEGLVDWSAENALLLAQGCGEILNDFTRRNIDVTLDFSLASVRQIHSLLEAFHKMGHGRGTIAPFILGFAWYMGENIVRRGGRWVARPRSGELVGEARILTVERSDGTAFDPIGLSLRTVEDGPDCDGLSFLSRVLASRPD
jgi:hypothetical protein